jgi:hypothetical protein
MGIVADRGGGGAAGPPSAMAVPAELDPASCPAFAISTTNFALITL